MIVIWLDHSVANFFRTIWQLIDGVAIRLFVIALRYAMAGTVNSNLVGRIWSAGIEGMYILYSRSIWHVMIIPVHLRYSLFLFLLFFPGFPFCLIHSFLPCRPDFNQAVDRSFLLWISLALGIRLAFYARVISHYSVQMSVVSGLPLLVWEW